MEEIAFPHGSLSPAQLVAILGMLPLDVTFVDENRIVRYFSEYRIFARPQSCLDRDVLECHSPASRPAVERLLSELASGWMDTAEFLTHKDDRLVEVRYHALRDGNGDYLGCLEVCNWAAAE